MPLIKLRRTMQNTDDSFATLLDVGNGKSIKSEVSYTSACGAPTNEYLAMNGNTAQKRRAASEDDEDDDDEDIGMASDLPTPPRTKTMPANGKKTKGRVKIKMEFIDNKLRRYTTFSKRKTGIMKKAYELSTLTGTQVMLLVASETGHVYTFATRKLQPMITSEAGKALIQTCLNSPDPPLGPGGSGPDQRMSATGFEEVDLTYTVADDTENKDGLSRGGAFYIGGGVSSPSESGQSSGAPTPPPCNKQKPQLAVQLAQPSSGFTTILTGGPLPQGALQLTGTGSAPGTLYRLPSLVSLPSQGQTATTSQNLSLLSVMPSSSSSTTAVTGGGVVYQTAQGVVYTSSPTEGVILNLGQEHTGGNTGQQFITIPLSLTQKQPVVSSSSTSHISNKRAKLHK